MKIARLVVFATLAALLAGCTDDPPSPPVPTATQEQVIDLGNHWEGNVVQLPSGERVLLTYRLHRNGRGDQISTAAVLLPPLRAPER